MKTKLAAAFRVSLLLGSNSASAFLHSSSRPLSTVLNMSDYDSRKASFGMEDKATLSQIAKEDGVVFVDVRNPDEITASQLQGHPFLEGRALLAGGALDSDKKDAPHIVFCAKGGRAAKACQALRDAGYSRVYNAGGLTDVDFLS